MELRGEHVKVTALQWLMNSKKSKKYYESNSTTRKNIIEMYTMNVLNMRTVKEGTAKAGSFCNKIMEIARNNDLDKFIVRATSNIFQRVALDAKHSSATGGYKSQAWFLLAELLNKCDKNEKYESIRQKIMDYITGNVVEEVLTADEEFVSFDDINDLF